MNNINPIFESKNIEQLHGFLKDNFETTSDEEISYLEKIPNLIKNLYEKEMNATTSGLKQLRIKKQAAESIFYCYQIAVGKSDDKDPLLELGKAYLNDLNSSDVVNYEMEAQYEILRNKFNKALHEHLRNEKPLSVDALKAQKYSLALAKTLNLDLTKLDPVLNFLPPIHLSTAEKIEYNKAALVLNRQMEKRSIEDYVNDIKGLTATTGLLDNRNDSTGLQYNLIGYQKILKFDYPELSLKEIDYYRKILSYNAKILGVSLTSEQLELEKPIPIFGIDRELTTSRDYKPTIQNRDELERNFFAKLLQVDLLTEYMNISTVHRNLQLKLENEGQLNSIESSIYSAGLNKEKEIRQILSNLIFGEVPSIESMERTKASLLAQNDDFKIILLSPKQMTGQSAWFFSSDLKMLKEYSNEVGKKAARLEIAANIISNDSAALKLFEKMSLKDRQEINDILKRYQGKPKELIDEAFNWKTYHTQIEFIFSQKDLGKSAGNLDNFFYRGRTLPNFD